MIAIYQKYYNFFYLLELISIIYAKSFAFKVIMYDVLLKFNVMKCFSRFIRIAQSNQNN